ncbi:MULTISPECIES: helix-turn-helix domain-containing protein [unclassified Bradyrhizobium]|uniref:helix-turn-helix domain-containing protein n=1 Tax=unclassified Bradyrhizobium TaxID=2631580 RepID=UPI0005682CDD|nr:MULTISPECIES: helix-turn-helix domain-containing protein [Bradyrhizobium]UFW39098.1 helix-turn-helix domain-containing protein [Bradyrhizobium canariense]
MSMRVRLKADGRIVELRDGQEFPVQPLPIQPFPIQPVPDAAPPDTSSLAVRDLRRRACLTQMEFAAKLGVPVETIRNWEQGKRAPRGPARALLAVIAHAPETVFQALAKA